MKDKQARELIDMVYKKSLQNLTQILYLNTKTRDQQEQIRSLTDKIESLTDKIEDLKAKAKGRQKEIGKIYSMTEIFDNIKVQYCPKCERETLTRKHHYVCSFDVKEDGTLYKRPEYECLICGTKYDLKEQPVIRED